MSDLDGCSPVLTTRPLPWRVLRQLDASFLVLPHGCYARIEHALDACAEIMRVEEELATERLPQRPTNRPPCRAAG